MTILFTADNHVTDHGIPASVGSQNSLLHRE